MIASMSQGASTVGTQITVPSGPRIEPSSATVCAVTGSELNGLRATERAVVEIRSRLMVNLILAPDRTERFDPCPSGASQPECRNQVDMPYHFAAIP